MQVNLIKTVLNNNLRTPDSVTVVVGDSKKLFKYPEENEKVGTWILQKMEENFFLLPAEVYYNIGWDSDGILYCRYEIERE